MVFGAEDEQCTVQVPIQSKRGKKGAAGTSCGCHGTSVNWYRSRHQIDRERRQGVSRQERRRLRLHTTYAYTRRRGRDRRRHRATKLRALVAGTNLAGSRLHDSIVVVHCVRTLCRKKKKKQDAIWDPCLICPRHQTRNLLCTRSILVTTRSMTGLWDTPRHSPPAPGPCEVMITTMIVKRGCRTWHSSFRRYAGRSPPRGFEGQRRISSGLV
ncbi:hypothetical protein GGR51DRAFT_342964 [Nemania sp. FL0031]|nr:hypothetical protein GGR51DRAFT_342964 [Nemania sp. FL0031]